MNLWLHILQGRSLSPLKYSQYPGDLRWDPKIVIFNCMDILKVIKDHNKHEPRE